MDADLKSLFDGIEKLEEPGKEPATEALLRLFSELQVSLRASEMQRQVSDERLAVERAKVSASEETAVQERMKRQNAELEVEALRRTGLVTQDELLAERAARQIAEAKVQEMQLMKVEHQAAMGEQQTLMDRIAATIQQRFDAVLASLKPPGEGKPPPSYVFDLHRDGAGTIRTITAKQA